MEIIREEYPASRCTIQTSLILEYLLTRGSITHEECELFTASRGQKCTVLRSRIPEIRMKLFWPVKAVYERNQSGKGTHARYVMDFGALGKQAGLEAEAIRAAAKFFREDKFLFYNVAPFLEYAKRKFKPVAQKVESQSPSQTAFWADFAPMVRLHSRQDR